MVTDGRLLFAKGSGGCVRLVLLIERKVCWCWGRRWAETFDKKTIGGPLPIWKVNHRAYELEAMTPEQLQLILTETIDRVIDSEAFNAELEAEKQDARCLQAFREIVSKTVLDLPEMEDLGNDG